MNILRFVLLGLSAMAAVFLAHNFLQQTLAPEDSPYAGLNASIPSPPVEAPSEIDSPVEEMSALRARIEEEIETAPDYNRFFERLKDLYPGDYRAFLDEDARRVAKTGETGGADAILADALHVMRQSHGILAAKADSASLERIFKVQLAVLHALAAGDQSLCVEFLYGVTSPGFYRFSADNRPLVADMAIAGLEAIHNGQQNPIERTEPNSADFSILETLLRDKGLDDAEIDALLDGKLATPPMPDPKLCHLGEIYLESLMEMPEPSRSRIYGLAVELMARS